MAKSKDCYYAVRIGRKPGIYKTWKDCQEQTDYFKGAEYKKFSTMDEAQKYMQVYRPKKMTDWYGKPFM